MKLTVLVDNNTCIGQYYKGEPGLSYYLELPGEEKPFRLLWDLGKSGIFYENGEKLGVPWATLDALVFSHNHSDHVGGSETLIEKGYPQGMRVIGHPRVFEKKKLDQGDYINPFVAQANAGKCRLETWEKPREIAPRLTFLGEIPQVIPFEHRETFHERYTESGVEPDDVKDDSALVYEGEKGIYIITGCSHSGICNIVTYAQTLFPGKNILGLIGGFHLLVMDEKAKKTFDFLEERHIPALYPCHCCTFAPRAYLAGKREIPEIGVGFSLEWC